MKRVQAYYKTIKLLEALTLNTQKCPRYCMAYTINPLKAQFVPVLVFVLKATTGTQPEKKVEFILKTLDFLNEVKFQMRVLSDLHYITKEGFGNIAFLLEECFSQFSAWALSLGAKPQDLPVPADLYSKEEKMKLNSRANA